MAYVVQRAVDIVIRAFQQQSNVSDHRGQASSGCKQQHDCECSALNLQAGQIGRVDERVGCRDRRGMSLSWG